MGKQNQVKDVTSDRYNEKATKHGLERLEQMIFAVLPFEPSRIRGWQIWIAFLGYAIGREYGVTRFRGDRIELVINNDTRI